MHDGLCDQTRDSSGAMTGEYESAFRTKNLFFSVVERVEFEMAVLKQIKISGERRVFQDEETHQYFFIAHNRNSCGFTLVCTETSSSRPILSDMDRLAKDMMKCQTSH